MAHDDLLRNRGKVLTDQHVALHRDQDGGLHAVTSVCTQGRVACEPINFDPMRMADGIAPINDPVLLFRSPAYAVSFGKRLSNQ